MLNYNRSRTIISVYPSKFFPFHFVLSNLSGSVIDNPTPQIRSFTAHSANITSLVDVTCGMAAGSFAQASKDNSGGGMSAKMTPAAVLIIQNGVTKLVNVRNQDAISKILDMVPDLIHRFTGKDEVSVEATQKAEKMAEELKS